MYVAAFNLETDCAKATYLCLDKAGTAHLNHMKFHNSYNSQ